jgi:hypothetical protein
MLAEHLPGARAWAVARRRQWEKVAAAGAGRWLPSQADGRREGAAAVEALTAAGVAAPVAAPAVAAAAQVAVAPAAAAAAQVVVAAAAAAAAQVAAAARAAAAERAAAAAAERAAAAAAPEERAAAVAVEDRGPAAGWHPQVTAPALGATLLPPGRSICAEAVPDRASGKPPPATVARPRTPAADCGGEPQRPPFAEPPPPWRGFGRERAD